MNGELRHIFAYLEGRLGRVYLVGGAVRDLLLGEEPKDLDFATPLPPEEVLRRLEAEGLPTNLQGFRYGTVGTWLEGIPIEITTFRKDVETDGRQAKVSFGASLEEDLARRDFTVNAMALTARGHLIDPFGGEEDLGLRRVRAVGDPGARFQEDRLRVVRAARFAASLGGVVEEATWEAALREAPRVLESVSLPRLGVELTQGLLKGKGRFLMELERLGLLYEVLPELVGPHGPAGQLWQDPRYHPEGDVLRHLAQTLDRLEVPPGVDPEAAVWAALLHDVGKPKTAEPDLEGFYRFPRHEAVGAEMVPGIARRFGFSNAWLEAVERAVRLHMRPLQPPTPKAVWWFQAEAGDHLPLVEAVCRADGEGRRQDLEAWFAPQPLPLEPLVRGRDLVALGYEPGPEIGRLLQLAYDWQLEGMGREEILRRIVEGERGDLEGERGDLEVG